MNTTQQRNILRLILHVGVGKTGSSSIQFTLARNLKALAAQKVFYAGMNLENAPNPKFDWQHAGLSEKLLSQPSEIVTKQVSEVLSEIITTARSTGSETIVWSNEAYIDTNAKLRPALAAVRELGVEICIVAYLRRPSRWAQSGYIQWGIKHKTYKGPILPFMRWLELADRSFSTKLNDLAAALPGTINIRNYEACDDVVADFLINVLGVTNLNGIIAIRANDTMGPEETIVRAMFNNRQAGVALPAQFNRAFKLSIKYRERPENFWEHLMPSQSDLEETESRYKEDVMALNQLLAASGQPVLESIADSVKAPNIDRDHLIMLLADMTTSQACRIDELEDRLARIEARCQKTGH